MEISEKEFNKLSQLDRIEYGQKFLLSPSIKMSSDCVLFFIVSMLFNMSGDILCSKFVFFIALIMFIGDVTYFFLNKGLKKKIFNELENKYFKINIKKKK